MGLRQLSSEVIPFFQRSFPKLGNGFQEIVDSGFLTSGKISEETEIEITRYFDIENAILTNSWTNGALVALKALGIGSGDEVIVPAITFVATANVIGLLNAKCIIADVEESDGNTSLEKLKEKITSKTKAIILVHLYGKMVRVDEIYQYCKRKNIKLIEDCAHCFEGSISGIKPGQSSDLAIFSFYATKNITCGEGGAIITKNPQLAKKCKELKLHGMSASAKDRYVSQFYKHYDVDIEGFKANLPDLLAFMLTPQIRAVDSVREIREKKYNLYVERLQNNNIINSQVKLPTVGSKGVYCHCHHLFPIILKNEVRDLTIYKLNQRGIKVAVNFRSLTQLTLYKNQKAPIAENFGGGQISLPFFPDIKIDQIDKVVYELEEVLSENE